MTSQPRYAQAGIDYGRLDSQKRAALAAARETLQLVGPRGATPWPASLGAPAFLLTVGERHLALVAEGLGTKALIAAALEKEAGPAVYADVAYDGVAAIVGDLCAVGALPLALNAYFATANADWYGGGRGEALVRGWREGCEAAGCAWGGGESPALPGLVGEEGVELAGAALGAVPAGRAPILGQDLRPGDEIVLFASSGIHANGATLARRVAAALAEGYRTPLPSGVTYGQALLARSVNYVRLVEALLDRGPQPTFLAHITGHGLLKLMRPPQALCYRLERLPPVPEVAAFIAQHASLSPREAYATLNMGVGFACCVRPGGGSAVLALAQRLGYGALLAGKVEKGPRSVVVDALKLRYEGHELQLEPTPQTT